jgi:hypothetical protein
MKQQREVASNTMRKEKEMTNPKTIMIDDEKYVREADVKTSEPKKLDGMDYCIVRSRNQGVVCGYVESFEGQTVKLHAARQMWRWDSTFVLQDIANNGPRNAGKCKFSEATEHPLYMLEACAIITCTEKAANALIAVKAQKK